MFLMQKQATCSDIAVVPPASQSHLCCSSLVTAPGGPPVAEFPGAEQQKFAVVAEYLKRDGIVVVLLFEQIDDLGPIDEAGTKRQMVIATPAVIAHMHMGQAMAESLDHGRDAIGANVSVADIEMKAKPIIGIEHTFDFGNTEGGIGRMLNNDLQIVCSGTFGQFSETLAGKRQPGIAPDQRHRAAQVYIDPVGTEAGKELESGGNRVNGSPAHPGIGQRERQIPGGMANHTQAGNLEYIAQFSGIDMIEGSSGRLDCQVKKLEAIGGSPAGLGQRIESRIVHHSNAHRMLLSSSRIRRDWAASGFFRPNRQFRLRQHGILLPQKLA
jgi:hypothetical protein